MKSRLIRLINAIPFVDDFRNLGFVAWLLAAVAACIIYWWPVFIRLQLKGHFYWSDSLVSWLQVIAGVYLIILVYWVCETIDLGLSSKNIAYLSLCISFLLCYVGWYIHPNSAYKRQFAHALELEEQILSLEYEVKYNTQMPPHNHAAYREKIDELNKKSALTNYRLKHVKVKNEPTSLWLSYICLITGFLFLIISVIMTVNIFCFPSYTVNRGPFSSESETNQLDVMSKSFYRTLFLIFMVCGAGSLIIMGLGSIGAIAFLIYGIGSALLNGLHSLF